MYDDHQATPALIQNGLFGDGDLMPLTRGNFVGYDPARMTFQFTMNTPDGNRWRAKLAASRWICSPE